MNTTLEFDSIQCSFGERKVLDSIYIRCETGHITGLLGRNGSGKTTLLKIVFGATFHEQKSVRIDSESLGLTYLSKRRIAYLPQRSLIPSYLSIRKAFSLFNIPEESITGYFPETGRMMNHKPGELSGGYLRLFEIFLIVKSQAGFCLLDEPFSGLTPLFIDRVKAMLLSEKANKGILLTDHLHRHVTEIADRLYLLANGETYAVKDATQLISLGYVNSL